MVDLRATQAISGPIYLTVQLCLFVTEPWVLKGLLFHSTLSICDKALGSQGPVISL